MQFKNHFKLNLSLLKRIVGLCTVMWKADSINPLMSSSAVTWQGGHSAPSYRAKQKGLAAKAVVFFAEVILDCL